MVWPGRRRWPERLRGWEAPVNLLLWLEARRRLARWVKERPALDRSAALDGADGVVATADDELDGLVARVVWAVTSAARRMRSEPSCLGRAVVARDLLEVLGRRADVRIGVRALAGGVREGIAAHAWVEVAGQRVDIGKVPDEAFEVLPGRLQGRRSL